MALKIQMCIAVSGTFHGNVDGAVPGDVLEVDDVVGARYCRLHYAIPVVDRKEERAVTPPTPAVEERAVEVPVEVKDEEVNPEPTPEPASEPVQPKRGPGRPPAAK